MIEKLTETQELQIPIYRDKYLKKVFDYELSKNNTFESVRDSMVEMYKFCNLKEPIVILVDSPIACQIAANPFPELMKNQVVNQVVNQVLGQVRGQVRGQVLNQVENQVENHVLNQVMNQVRSQVRSQVVNQLWGQVSNQIREQALNQVENQVENQVRNQVLNHVGDSKLEYYAFSSYGNCADLGWLSYCDYFINEVKIETTHKENIDNIIKWAKSSFLSIQLDGLCIVSKYPNFIKRNSENSLHNTKGYAISFEDGYGQYYVNGKIVPDDLFNKVLANNYTFEEFQQLDNEEVKSSIITIIKENNGNKGVLDFLGAECVDEKQINHANGYIETQRLYKTKQPFGWANDSKGNNNTKLAWNEMTCPSTGSVYLIETCPSFTDVIESAKFLRPNNIPMTLQYLWERAN